MISTLQAILSLVLPAALVTARHATEESTQTLENLEEAFNGESNARNRYLAFAKKADEEGYGPVASLFRATARAEEVHADNHAEVIHHMDGVPKAVIETPVVKSTRENLLAAIAGEEYERDTMYPAFVEKAKAERHSSAVRTFVYALKAETEHARLFKNALNDLDNLKGKSRNYWVCTICGYTTESINFMRCLVCAATKDKYVSVN